MKPDFYIFEYSTKTCKHKIISYTAYSWRSALRQFKKNVHCTKLIGKWKVSNYYRRATPEGETFYNCMHLLSKAS